MRHLTYRAVLIAGSTMHVYSQQQDGKEKGEEERRRQEERREERVTALALLFIELI